MAAGKTFDVMITAPAGTTPPAIPVYDRELSLSGNASERDAGMLAYIGINGGALPTGAQAGLAAGFAQANNDSYPALVPSQTLTVSDVSKGVIANDLNVYGVQLITAPTLGTVTLNANGTFTYVPLSSTSRLLRPLHLLRQRKGYGRSVLLRSNRDGVARRVGAFRKPYRGSITYTAKTATT